MAETLDVCPVLLRPSPAGVPVCTPIQELSMSSTPSKSPLRLELEKLILELYEITSPEGRDIIEEAFKVDPSPDSAEESRAPPAGEV